MTSTAADNQSPPRHGRRARLAAHIPRSTRKRVAIVVAVLAIAAATYVSSLNILQLLLSPELNLLGYLSLFVACWIGAGGALVPIPGVRAISWVMIVQQGAAFDPLIVALIAGSAMVLGQSSYFLATRATQNRRHQAAVAEVGTDTGATVDLKAVSTAAASAASEPEDELEAESEPDTHRRRLPGWMSRAGDRIQTQIQRRGFVTVYIVCALPTPLTTLTTTAAAGSGMGYSKYVVAAYAGFLTLSTTLAFLGDNLFGGIFPLR